MTDGFVAEDALERMTDRMAVVEHAAHALIPLVRLDEPRLHGHRAMDDVDPGRGVGRRAFAKSRDERGVAGAQAQGSGC